MSDKHPHPIAWLPVVRRSVLIYLIGDSLLATLTLAQAHSFDEIREYYFLFPTHVAAIGSAALLAIVFGPLMLDRAMGIGLGFGVAFGLLSFSNLKPDLYDQIANRTFHHNEESLAFWSMVVALVVAWGAVACASRSKNGRGYVIASSALGIVALCMIAGQFYSISQHTQHWIIAGMATGGAVLLAFLLIILLCEAPWIPVNRNVRDP